ncbi:protein lin-52 homolog isoform X2 [Drosophila tropicalis]|uniref:protein lin-52 homolog isoform X2 n=1 Tax=Drosophila tropicalis TaxID=46794 RepID=UPI0035AB697D
MSTLESRIAVLDPECMKKTNDANGDNDANVLIDEDTEDPSTTLADKEPKDEDDLISMETLRESPLQWPERCMEEFLTTSHTPIHTPVVDCIQSWTDTDMAKINKLASMTPDQLIEKIKLMHDEIYQLGLREAKEMTRGKLLGIFDRDRTPKIRK